MSTVQVWANQDDLETLRRIRAFLEHQQEEEFEGKSYRMETRHNRKRRIRRETINNSYIYRQALSNFWIENEETIVDFEKRRRNRDF